MMDDQASNAPYGTLGGTATQAQRVQPPQSRTFDGISDAVGRVRATRDQVSRMLDRIAPTPRAVPEGGAMKAVLQGRPPYASSLEQLHAELHELGAQLDQLDKHV